MRCVIDLQGVQNESRFRGIGRYSFNLAQAMAREPEEHELWLALNACFPEQVERIRSDFQGIVPQHQIVTYGVPHPCAEMEERNDWRARAAEKVRESFLEGLDPDVVYVLSLFDGWCDDSVTSIGSFACSLPTAAVLYDLIPLIRPNEYLPDTRRREWYARKLRSLQSAQLLTAISEWSIREAVERANVPEDRIAAIGCGVGAQFKPITLSPSRRSELRHRYGISGEFILYSGAVDARKNIEGLILAFALLPKELRNSYQLVIAGAHSVGERELLLNQIQVRGLARNSVVLTGYVPDEDLIALYNGCALFVLPSFHEGFGLPALEAMACGAPTIGADATSIPEVIGRADALFDPQRPSSIAGKIEEILSNDALRRQLREHGLVRSQRFTWESCAALAWRALEKLHETRSDRFYGIPSETDDRQRLAYFSPASSVRGGIVDYSAELLPELARYYEIEIIAFPEEGTDIWAQSKCAVRKLSYFEANASRYSRILYHMGNSPSHAHMWRMMERYPGTVVLDDFYQSGVLDWVEREVGVAGVFGRALYRSHGYGSLLRDMLEGREKTVETFPCNRHVLDAAAGIIVHSQHAIALAEQVYGPRLASDWVIIPQVGPGPLPERAPARARLGFADTDYVVCCFGTIGESNLNHRLVSAWCQSGLESDNNCKLVFVGEMDEGEYGRLLQQEIQSKGLAGQVVFTGLDNQTYRDHLAAVDQTVQLRTRPLGEASRVVFDCAAYGLPIIVNSHCALCDLPTEVALILPGEFEDAELAAALAELHGNSERRREFGLKGGAVIHDLSGIAEQYSRAVERFAKTHRRAREEDLFRDIGTIETEFVPDQTDLLKAASAVANNRLPCGPRQILLDVSETAKYDAKTGIQRVTRAITMEYIQRAPTGFRIEPVRGLADQYWYARTFTLKMLGSDVEMSDTPVEVQPEDIYLALDLSAEAILSSRGFFDGLRTRGIRICFLVYDLLPLLLPHRFPLELQQVYRSWLEAIVAVADKLIAISRATADELIAWLNSNPPKRLRPIQICYSHLGADIQASSPSKGLPDDATKIVSSLRARPSFLMVGTMEPRKGHSQVLAAFHQLWAAGVDINLVIVGKQGWMMEEWVERIHQHREIGRRLFWLAGISDEMLLRTYETSSALIAASEAEGFGLPLVEAAHHNLPIIARDIPVFREVAGDHATYFNGTSPECLAAVIRHWLLLYSAGAVPDSSKIRCLSWQDSAMQLLDVVAGDQVYAEWPP
jgi:glycosyltransferase involved in cell wall biosynthesis